MFLTNSVFDELYCIVYIFYTPIRIRALPVTLSQELSQTERFRLDSEIQRIDTERRLLEEEKRKLETEIQVKGQENLRYKNSLLEEQKRQMEQMAQTKQKIASEWAEIQKAKQSLFDIVKPDAFAKYEENVRQSAGN